MLNSLVAINPLFICGIEERFTVWFVKAAFDFRYDCAIVSFVFELGNDVGVWPSGDCK
jgi:hypothetical protein